MAAIIAQLLAMFGPLILKWLESLLNKSAKIVDETGDKEQDTKNLLEQALSDMKGRPFRKAVVRFLLHVAPKKIAKGEKLSSSERKELKGLTNAA